MTPSSVLIIDDDPMFQIIAEACARKVGAQSVVLADNGDHGLKVLADNPTGFDLVICDLQMPKLDGVGVIRSLTTLGFEGRLIIASSEKSEVLRTVLAMAQIAGIRVLGTLAKPLREEAFRALLEHDQTAQQEQARQIITRHELKHALSSGAITPSYQPKVCLKTGKVVGVEVLARIRREADTGPGLPAFLEAAEREHMTVAFLTNMVRQAFADSRQWQSRGIDLNMAINVSPAALTDLDLPDMLAEEATKAGLSPKSITIEITEDRLVAYAADVLDVLARCRLLGFRLSMDDFGTGATSIDQLRLYPFNELKIDKSFVQSAADDEFSRTTVETSVRLAGMLGLSVVAEGIETEDQLKMVRDAGIDEVQGYLFARAMPVDDFLVWLDAFDSKERGRTAA